MKTVAPYPKPAIGQCWADNDPRSYGRLIIVRNIITVNDVEYAMCEGRRHRMHKIRLDRFKPTSNGYRLFR